MRRQKVTIAAKSAHCNNNTVKHHWTQQQQRQWRQIKRDRYTNAGSTPCWRCRTNFDLQLAFEISDKVTKAKPKKRQTQKTISNAYKMRIKMKSCSPAFLAAHRSVERAACRLFKLPAQL